MFGGSPVPGKHNSFANVNCRFIYSSNRENTLPKNLKNARLSRGNVPEDSEDSADELPGNQSAPVEDDSGAQLNDYAVSEKQLDSDPESNESSEVPVLRSMNDLFEIIDWRQSAIYGGVAWVATYVFLFITAQITGAFRELPQEISKTDVVFQLLFSGAFGSFVPVDENFTEPSILYISELIEATQNTDPVVIIIATGVQFLIPAGILFVAGKKLIQEYKTAPKPTAAAIGSSILVGWGGMMLLASQVFSPLTNTTAGSFGILTAGMALPVAFGGLGAVSKDGIANWAPSTDIYSATAALAGGVLWVLLAESEDGTPITQEVDFSAIEEVIIAGVWYIQQHGPLSVSNTSFGLSGSYTMGWIVWIAPILGGYLIVSRESTPTSHLQAMLEGASTARGYGFIMAIISFASVLVVIDEVQEQTLEFFLGALVVISIPSILFAGVVWAGILGAVGGIIAYNVK